MSVNITFLTRLFIFPMIGMLVCSCDAIDKSASTHTGNLIMLLPSQHSRFSVAATKQDTTPTSLELRNITSKNESKLSEHDRKLVQQGRNIFSQICATCHGPEGKGLTAMGAPPLVNSKRVMGESAILVKILVDGLIGPIDGKTYPDYMPPLGAANDDEWIASVLSYIRNDFGNLASPIVNIEEVKKIRSQSPGRASMWTLEELLKVKR